MSENPHIPKENPDFIEKEPVTEAYPQPEIKKSTNKGVIIGLIVAVGFAAFFAGLFFANMDSDVVTKSELNQALSRLENKIDNLSISDPREEIKKISIDDDPVRGDKNAPITIIEFSDYQCPFCARFHVQTLPLLLDEYIESGKVNLVYRDFPIQNIHPNAIPAAVAAECANEQGKYWEYHDTLFENQRLWSDLDFITAGEMFKKFATEIDLNQGQFDDCFDGGKYLAEIRKDLDDGREYGISGTPGFFIGNDEIGYVQVNGAQPFEVFEQIINSQLET